MFRGHFTKWNLLPVHGWIQVLCFRGRPHVGSEKKKPERDYGVDAHILVTSDVISPRPTQPTK